MVVSNAAMRYVPSISGLLANRIARVRAAVFDDMEKRMIVVIGLQADTAGIDYQAVAGNRISARLVRVAANDQAMRDAAGILFHLNEIGQSSAVTIDLLEENKSSRWPVCRGT